MKNIGSNKLGKDLPDTFIINSDAKSNSGVSYHSEWIDKGIAVTSGGAKYLKAINRPKKGNVLLLWANEKELSRLGG